MFKWLNKLKVWRREPSGPAVHEYGRYQLKPVMARTLSVVIGITQSELCSWIASPEIDIYLNDELIQGAQWARGRLESGGYEIKIPQHDKIWRFYIQ